MTSAPAVSQAEVNPQRWGNLVTLLLLVLHVIAVCRLLPPAELFRQDPIAAADHPMHAYDLSVYREALRESGLPWGYDPVVSAGKVLRPVQDAGGKPQEFLGALLPSVNPWTVIRWSLFLSMLTFPIWTYLAAARLGFDAAQRAWVLLVLLAAAWLYGHMYGSYLWGQVAYPTAAYMCPYLLAMFLSAIAQPSLRLFAAIFALLSMQFMLHVMGPIVLAPSLLLFTLLARPLPARWRLAALAAPIGVVAVNAFWFVPFALALRSPSPPGRPFEWYPPDLRYLSVEHLLAVLSPLRIAAALAGTLVTVWGLVLLQRLAGKRVALCWGLTIFFGLFLKFAGSFIPGISLMQPSRFFTPTIALMTLPVGLVLQSISGRLRVPVWLGVPGLATAAVLAAALMPQRQGTWKYLNYAGAEEHDAGSFPLKLPPPVPQPQLLPPLEEFIDSRTDRGDRLLVQTVIEAEPLALPMACGREVVGNTYPDLFDPAQFLYQRLFGRPLKEWSPETLRAALERWGITWAFVHTPEAVELFEATTGKPPERVGLFRAFRVQQSFSAFLVGRGEAVARVNRIELKNLTSAKGLVVLRYRYHPALEADEGVIITPYAIPEDPAGFIALRDPPSSVTLRFKPWRALKAAWPSVASAAEPGPGHPTND
jgi:hypothetical protein